MGIWEWTILSGLAATALVLFLVRAVNVWRDAASHGVEIPSRVAWTLAGGLAPARYWWGYRPGKLSAEQTSQLLRRETAALHLTSPTSIRCPLCGREIPGAWRINEDGEVAVGAKPVACIGCDFRLDCCRFCRHFSSGARGAGGSIGAHDPGSGRCAVYKKRMPVESFCGAAVARRLRERGIFSLNGELPIADSYFPPDFCRAFTPDAKKMKTARISWPDRKRAALITLACEEDARSDDGPLSPDEEAVL